eukprot:gene13658-16084_t
MKSKSTKQTSRSSDAIDKKRENHCESERRGRERRRVLMHRLSEVTFGQDTKCSYEQILARALEMIAGSVKQEESSSPSPPSSPSSAESASSPSPVLSFSLSSRYGRPITRAQTRGTYIKIEKKEEESSEEEEKKVQELSEQEEESSEEEEESEPASSSSRSSSSRSSRFSAKSSPPSKLVSRSSSRHQMEALQQPHVQLQVEMIQQLLGAIQEESVAREQAKESHDHDAAETLSNLFYALNFQLNDNSCVAVDKVSPKLYDDACVKFSKHFLKPLFHYDISNSTFHDSHWRAYKEFNKIFARKIAEIYQPGDIIWIHGKKLLKGVLGADMIAFQSYSYLRYFVQSCTKLLGLPAGFDGVRSKNVLGRDHLSRVSVFPEGIDPHETKMSLEFPEVRQRISDLKETFKGKKILLSMDQGEAIEATKLKLVAYERFLRSHSNWIGSVVFFLICEPCGNSKIISEVNETVARINGEFGQVGFVPVEYIGRRIAHEEICALYHVADVFVSTPLREGMNLDTHDFVACHRDSPGVLILSEFDGASRCFGGALSVNPWSANQVSNAIDSALRLTPEEIQIKHDHNLHYVLTNTSFLWGEAFLYDLFSCRDHHLINERDSSLLDTKILDQKYRLSDKRRIFLLGMPELDGWKNLSEGTDMSWLELVQPILEYFTERTPGSTLEYKKVTVTWSYQNNHSSHASDQAQDLLTQLLEVSGKAPIDIIHSNGLIEIKPSGTSNGMAMKKIIDENPDIDFILCMGDERTDIKMFELLDNENSSHFAVSVGKIESFTKYYINSQNHVLRVLDHISSPLNSNSPIPMYLAPAEMSNKSP